MGLPFYKVPLTKNKYAKKVIWRTWGHDIRPCKKTESKFMNLCLKYIFSLYIKKIKKFAYVGIANDIDVVSVEEWFGKMNYCKIPYAYDVDSFSKLSEIRNSKCNADHDKAFNILVGHSGFAIDRHEEVLDFLSKYKDENIRIYLPLSYGNADYIKNVKMKAENIFGGKAICLTERMDYFKYADFLSKMDIAFFNQEYSSALGNFSLLLFFGVPIIYNQDSYFVKSFEKNNILDFLTIQHIWDFSFNELKKIKCSDSIRELYCDVVPAIERAKRLSAFLDSLSK